MTHETRVIAARLAAASERFPIVRQDDWDAVAYATAEENVITVVVTDHKSRATREYRAELKLIAETATAPARSGADTPGEDRRALTTQQGTGAESW